MKALHCLIDSQNEPVLFVIVCFCMEKVVSRKAMYVYKYIVIIIYNEINILKMLVVLFIVFSSTFLNGLFVFILVILWGKKHPGGL